MSKCVTLSLTVEDGAVFNVAREQLLAKLPEHLQKTVVAKPSPHITLLYGCADNHAAAQNVLSNYGNALTFDPTEYVTIGDVSPVVLCPLPHRVWRHMFTELYESKELVPDKTTCPHTLFPDKVCKNNPYGFDPHLTLAVFDKDTDMADVAAHLPTFSCPEMKVDVRGFIWEDA